MRDRWAGLAVLALAVLVCVTVFERLDRRAAVVVAMILFGPFSILVVAMTRGALRTSRGWDRPKGPKDPESER